METIASVVCALRVMVNCSSPEAFFMMCFGGLDMRTEHMTDLVEPYAVPDTYCSGLAEVEDIGGGNYRFTFYCLHRVGGREERQVVARLIMASAAIPSAMRMTARETCACACDAAVVKNRH